MTPDGARAWIAGLGGRRFLLTLGAGVMSTLLAAFDKLDSLGYVAVIGSTVAAYIAGNTAQKRAGAKDDADRAD